MDIAIIIVIIGIFQSQLKQNFHHQIGLYLFFDLSCTCWMIVLNIILSSFHALWVLIHIIYGSLLSMIHLLSVGMQSKNKEINMKIMFSSTYFSWCDIIFLKDDTYFSAVFMTHNIIISWQVELRSIFTKHMEIDIVWERKNIYYSYKPNWP